MQSESWDRGQMFDRMASLAGFTGNADFWGDLPIEFQREYAAICRPNPRSRLFSLELWQNSKAISEAVAEYRAEKESEAADPSNVNLDF
jgi:hypothetical protein